MEVLKEGRTKPYPAIFIRAHRLVEARPPAHVIARLADGTAVAAAAGRLLVTSFHPGLSRDLRFHDYFLEMVRSQINEETVKLHDTEDVLPAAIRRSDDTDTVPLESAAQMKEARLLFRKTIKILCLLNSVHQSKSSCALH